MNDAMSSAPAAASARRQYPERILREARFLAAANLGVVAGVLLWRSALTDGRKAERVQAAEYAAQCAARRKELIDAGRIPLAAFVIVTVIFALVAMGIYELTVYGLTRFLGRNIDKN